MTATRARGRTRPTARVNSGSMTGWAGAPDLARSSRRLSMSPAPGSPGLTTRMRLPLTKTPRSYPLSHAAQNGTGPRHPAADDRDIP